MRDIYLYIYIIQWGTEDESRKYELLALKLSDFNWDVFVVGRVHLFLNKLVHIS